MNIHTRSTSLKRLAIVALGVALFSLVGQSVGNAYQYPALTKHMKTRIFISSKNAKKAPVMAALRTLPPVTTGKANVMAQVNVAVSPVGVTSINFGDATPTYVASYAPALHGSAAHAATCAIVNEPLALPIPGGSYTVQCSGPASEIAVDDLTMADTLYVFDYSATATLTVAPIHQSFFSISGGAALVGAGGITAVVTKDIRDTGSVTFALDTPNTLCSVSPAGLVDASAPTTCSVTASITADNSFLAATSAPADFVFSNPVVTPVTHTVTYNLGGGTGTLPTQSPVAENATFSLASASGLSKASDSSYSYTFNKWSIGLSSFAAGSTYTMLTSDLSFTALWTATALPVVTPPVITPPVITPPVVTPPVVTPPVVTPPVDPTTPVVQPIVLPKTPVTVPTAPVFTKKAVASNLVANFTKIVDITARTSSVSVPHDAGTSLTLTDGVAASVADQLNLSVTATGVSVTAVKGWTGRISVPVVATQSGTQVELFIGVEEDPAAAVTPAFSLVNLKSAQVSWATSGSQVELYNVYLGSQLLCTTAKTSCVVPVGSIHNFATNASIESVGHQTTYSTKVVPVYAAKSLVQAGLVHFTLGSSTLTPAAKKSLDSMIKVIKSLGVTNVNLNGHTDAQGAEAANKALSVARANAVKAYLAKALPKVKFNGKGFSSTVPAASNASSKGQADNRRVEVLVG